MREYLRKILNFNGRISCLPILFFFLFCITGTAVAEEEPPAVDTDVKTVADRIHVTADRLIAEPKSETAEFIGNVNATQGNTSITSDRLKIYYKSASNDKGSGAANAILKKIVADGHVTIKMDDQVAVTDKAVYITENEVLILTGQNSTVTSERNSISGDKITLFRADNRMVVDGSGKERVEAILYTNEKGIQ